MRFYKLFICIGLGAAVLCTPLRSAAQSAWIQGPILGFTPDNSGTVIRPVLGVQGASTMGEPLKLSMEIRGAAFSPKQDYAIAVRAGDGQVMVIDLGAAAPAAPAVGTYPAPDLIATSPTGSAAALYYQESMTVQVIGQLPGSPQVIQQFDTSQVPDRAAAMAVSDDGGIVLIKAFESGTEGLWIVNASGATGRILLDRPSAAAFFPNRRDAVVTDDTTQSVFLISDVGNASTQMLLISAAGNVANLSSVSTSADGQRVYVADAESGSIAIVDMSIRQPVWLSCQCRPTGFYPLKGASTFRLTEPSTEPMMALDASLPEPRILFMPPNVSASLEAR
jgi:DNA-binding beta-propeller fold protein YncE